MSAAQWERIITIYDKLRVVLYRLKVPGGWLVTMSLDSHGTMVYVNDPSHSWIVDSEATLERPSATPFPGIPPSLTATGTLPRMTPSTSPQRIEPPATPAPGRASSTAIIPRPFRDATGKVSSSGWSNPSLPIADDGEPHKKKP